MGAYRVVETLSRTGGFGVRVTKRRLLETLQHFMEVVEDIDSVKPGGKGYVSSSGECRSMICTRSALFPFIR